MTNPSDKPVGSSFSTFGLGVAFGIAAAFLFGTEEGRKMVKKAIDSLPEKYKNPLESVSRQGGTHSTSPTLHSTTLITPEETPHHSTFDPSLEAPPPPSPHVRPVRPEPFKPGL